MIKVGISQRRLLGPHTAQFVLRNFTLAPDSSTVEFSLKGAGPTLYRLRQGETFSLPVGKKLNVEVQQMNGLNAGDKVSLLVQPYELVALEYDIFHFYHEENSEVMWAIGSPSEDREGLTVCVLRSEDDFKTYEKRWSGQTRTLQYKSIYMDMYGNLIINWQPGPMISRDGGYTFEHLFSWLDADNGILCPFWNITEDDNGLMIISEYGSSEIYTEPHGSHRGTFWSSDPQRKLWTTKVVDAGFDIHDVNKFGGYFRHIHGYHINPELPNVHHLFLGDSSDGHKQDSAGYFVSLDDGKTWGDEIITNWPGRNPAFFYNGPCFITWWPDGKAFIASDSQESGNAYSWGSGPVNWGGTGFDPVVELNRDVDSESRYPTNPWMAMAVKNSYETYCTTVTSDSKDSAGKEPDPPKEIVWRYDYDPSGEHSRITVLAETWFRDTDFKTCRWLSGSRHNRIPSHAKYFFTSGNRRFPR